MQKPSKYKYQSFSCAMGKRKSSESGAVGDSSARAPRFEAEPRKKDKGKSKLKDRRCRLQWH